jgi:hypothetical protein
MKVRTIGLRAYRRERRKDEVMAIGLRGYRREIRKGEG